MERHGYEGLFWSVFFILLLESRVVFPLWVLPLTIHTWP